MHYVQFLMDFTTHHTAHVTMIHSLVDP